MLGLSLSLTLVGYHLWNLNEYIWINSELKIRNYFEKVSEYWSLGEISQPIKYMFSPRNHWQIRLWELWRSQRQNIMMDIRGNYLMSVSTFGWVKYAAKNETRFCGHNRSIRSLWGAQSPATEHLSSHVTQSACQAVMKHHLLHQTAFHAVNQ